APTDGNAHPHLDCSEKIAVVHNGIIENHDVLRRKLEGEGHTFRSDTDTEVAAHLIESIIASEKCSLLDAVREAVNVLEGAFALVCISALEPDVIITARQEPPIIVGATATAGLVASDIPALLAHTRDMIPLQNRQIAEVKPGSVRLFDFDGEELEPESIHIDWDLEAAEKGGYEDFMLKEIHEQPEAVLNTMRGRVDENNRIFLDEVHWKDEELKASTRSSWLPVAPPSMQASRPSTRSSTGLVSPSSSTSLASSVTAIPCSIDGGWSSGSLNRARRPTRSQRFVSPKRWVPR
ncbi:MAG: hypothetical protein H0U16_05130, partial [Actinobacteria bacterium]|nr:hypothetical protein [Actinomycetota bacterium]